MHTMDFFTCIGSALAASLGLYLHWYPLALFATLFFFLVLANITIFYVSMPQPRWIIGLGIPKNEEESEEEEPEE